MDLDEGGMSSSPSCKGDCNLSRGELVGNVTFEQGGVVVHGQSYDRDRDMVCTGQLQIREYKVDLAYVEWKPNSDSCKTISMEQNRSNDLDWAIVNTCVGYKAGQGDAAVQFVNGQSPVLPIHIPVNTMRKLRLDRNQQLIIVEKDGTSSPPFLFTKGSAEGFICALRRYAGVENSPSRSSRSRKDRRIYHVTPLKCDSCDGFSTASSSPAPPHTSTRSAVYNLITKPTYENALHTFSKLYEFTMYGFQQQSFPTEEEAAELLQRSLSIGDSNSLEHHFETGDNETPSSGCSKLNCVVYPLPKINMEAPLSTLQWAAYLQDDGTVERVDEMIKVIAKGGVTPDIRGDVWKFLLGYHQYDQTTTQREKHRQECRQKYFEMKLQWKSISEDQESRFSAFRERKNLVEKDVCRTDRTNLFFSGDSNPNVQTLLDILMTYVMYNFDLGYVQGMSDLLSPLLVVLKDEVDTFWCFKGFMDKIGKNFEFSQNYIKEQLSNLHLLLKLTDPELCSYLEQHESGNLFFCFRWLLVWFKRDFAFGHVMRLWEIFWTDLPCPNFHLFCILANLIAERTTLMQAGSGFTEILKHVNDMSMNLDVQTMLGSAEGIYQRLLKYEKDLPDNIREILGLEPIENPEDGNSTPTSPNMMINTIDSNEDASSIEVISGDDEDRDYEFSLMFQT